MQVSKIVKENLLTNSQSFMDLSPIMKEAVNDISKLIQKETGNIIEKFEKDTGLDVRVSGMPYIRTMNAQNIIDEIGMFVGLALGITSLIFFVFFSS